MGFFFKRSNNRPYEKIGMGDQQPEPFSHRRSNVIKWWTYYHGSDPLSGESQWTHLYRRYETMPKRDIEDIENHTRICTDRLRRLLVNSWRGFEIEGEGAETAVTEVFRRNRWPHLLNLIALYGKVTGDAFVKLVPAGQESPFAPIRLILLDTESVELETSPHDRDELKSVAVSYDFFDRDGADGRLIRRSYREIIDRAGVTAFVDDEYAAEYSWEHNLGFIPVVHVRNSDTGGGIYGESYVSRLIEAQDGLNLLTSDLVDIVRYDGHKTTVFQNVVIDKGASRDGMTSGEIDLSIGKGLVVKGDGKVYKLDQQHDLGAALQEYDRKLEAFYGLAGLPRISGDIASRLGNLSGKAIERLYQDAIESTREAQNLYGDAFSELAWKTAAMLGQSPERITALWNTDVLTAEVETLAKEKEIGARSLKSVMRKLGIPNPERMLAEIAAEAERE